MRLYLAGPYSSADPAERLANVQAAFRAGRELLRQGHAPFIPHLAHWFAEWSEEQGCPLTYHDYLTWDAAFLAVSDGLVLLGSSPGAEQELELAVRLGKPILAASRGDHYATGCDKFI